MVCKEDTGSIHMAGVPPVSGPDFECISCVHHGMSVILVFSVCTLGRHCVLGVPLVSSMVYIHGTLCSWCPVGVLSVSKYANSGLGFRGRDTGCTLYIGVHAVSRYVYTRGTLWYECPVCVLLVSLLWN